MLTARLLSTPHKATHLLLDELNSSSMILISCLFLVIISKPFDRDPKMLEQHYKLSKLEKQIINIQHVQNIEASVIMLVLNQVDQFSL